ncbi:nucleoside triphosphate pyrophosphohydrolase [Mycolicibacterium thermoresistibile]
MGKLVRNRIPELIRDEGRKPRVRTLDHAEFRTALHAKLREEVDKLRGAVHRDAVLEEAADVLEVLTAIVSEHGADLDSIVDAARAKRARRGGFEMRLWLDGVES